MNTEKIDLGNGEYAELRTDLTRADRRWWQSRVDEVRRSNGTAKPQKMEPDPDNPANLRTIPAEPGYLRPEESMQLTDELTARLLVSWSLPEPWSPAYADTLDLDMFDALDEAVTIQMNRLNGIAPKKKTSTISTGTSPDPAPAPRTEQTPKRSGTASGSSGAG